MSNAPNPFAAPAAESAPPAQAASYALHSTTAIGLATFLGTMISGGILMALNSKRLGRPQQGILTLVLATLGTAGVITLGAVLPEGVPSSVFVIPQILAMAQAAKAMFGADLEAHERAGGKIASKWYAAGVSLAVILVLVVVVGVFMLATGQLDEA